MAEDDAAFDLGEIEKLFTKAKSSGEAYPFAFGLASKPEECGFAVHLRKAGPVLKKEMKSASRSIKKACFGTFTMDGNDVRLSSDKPVKGIIKQLKKRFRDAGLMKYKPMLVGPDGAEIDEESLPDDTDEVDDDADEAAAEDVAEEAPAEAAPAEAAADDLAALKARLLAIRPRLDGVPKEQAGPVVAAFTKAVGQVRDGDAAGAAATMDAIERALDRLSAAPPAPPPGATGDAAARLTAALASLVPRIRALPAGPALQALADQARAAHALIAAGDAAGAAAALKALAADLAAAEKGGAEPAASPLDIWNAAKEQVDTGITKLQAALRGVKHPQTDRIAEFGLAGLSGSGVQTAIIASLMSYNRAAAAERAQAAPAVIAAIGAYRSFLGSSKLVDLCERNPFGVALDIRGVIGRALDEIERVMA